MANTNCDVLNATSVFIFINYMREGGSAPGADGGQQLGGGGGNSGCVCVCVWGGGGGGGSTV